MTYYIDILIQKKVQTAEEYDSFRSTFLNENNAELDFWYHAGWSTDGFTFKDLEEADLFGHHKGTDAKN